MRPGEAGGIEQATYELISAIARIDRRNRYLILAPRSALQDWDFPRDFDVSLHDSDAGSVPSALEFDGVHSLSGYIHPDLIERPGVLTMNDLQHVHHPEFFTPDDWRLREKVYRDSVERARHVVCISEFTRQDVHRSFGAPLEKLTTIWIIPGHWAALPLPEAKRREILGPLGVKPPFLLFPGHGWPHKNHARLVEAFAQARHALPPDLTLVFTGRPFGPDHPALARIRESDLGSRIVHLGYRSRLELRALLHECHALVFPSLFEGFGMPVAEAIIAAKPVACSNVTSLPEIGGDAVLLFDPMDVDDIAKRLVDVSTRGDVRDALVQAARRRSTAFSAERSARQTLAVYDQAFA